MTTSNERRDQPAGWPGVFRPLRHYVADDAPRLELWGQAARRLGLVGFKVWFAACGAPCWPPDDATQRLPWCTVCERARALQW